MLYEDLSEKIIGCFYKVYNNLGYGFLEKVYENALVIEFRKAGIDFERQVPVKVFYEGEIVGEYVCDFIVGGKIVVEVKALKILSGSWEAQLLNYLRATDLKVGLLLNFGREAEFKRRVMERRV
jgi:GxxExxY protein